jgi:hypothetical protein
MVMQNPSSWVFVTGVSLAVFSIYQLGSAFLVEPFDRVGALWGALSLLAGVALTLFGKWVWDQRS